MKQGIESLSRRQRECLLLVGKGHATERIAGELKIAVSTVNGHIEEAVRKMGVPNRRIAGALVLEDALSRAKTVELPPEKIPPENDPMAREEENAPFLPPAAVAEERVPFDGPITAAKLIGADTQRSETDRMVAVIARVTAIAALLALIIMALPSLSENAGALANLIAPHRYID